MMAEPTEQLLLVPTTSGSQKLHQLPSVLSISQICSERSMRRVAQMKFCRIDPEAFFYWMYHMEYGQQLCSARSLTCELCDPNVRANLALYLLKGVKRGALFSSDTPTFCIFMQDVIFIPSQCVSIKDLRLSALELTFFYHHSFGAACKFTAAKMDFEPEINFGVLAQYLEARHNPLSAIGCLAVEQKWLSASKCSMHNASMVTNKSISEDQKTLLQTPERVLLDNNPQQPTKVCQKSEKHAPERVHEKVEINATQQPTKVCQKSEKHAPERVHENTEINATQQPTQPCTEDSLADVSMHESIDKTTGVKNKEDEKLAPDDCLMTPVEETQAMHAPPDVQSDEPLLASVVRPQQATQRGSMEQQHLTTGRICSPVGSHVFDQYSSGAATMVYLLGIFHIIVFEHSAVQFNDIMLKMNRFFVRCMAYHEILGRFGPIYTDTAAPQFSKELNRLQAAIMDPLHQCKTCTKLLLDFGKKIEQCVVQGTVPFTDAAAITFLPFAQEMELSLSETSLSCYQIQLPHALTFDQTIAFLLSCAKILASCATDSDILKLLEIEDQCFVFLESSAYLCTRNHKLGVLLKVFPEHSVAFCIVAASNNKTTKDYVDSFLNRLPIAFTSQFEVSNYRFVEIFHQLPSEMERQISGSSEDYTNNFEAVCIESATMEDSNTSLLQSAGVYLSESGGHLEPTSVPHSCALEQGFGGNNEVVGCGTMPITTYQEGSPDFSKLLQEGIHYLTAEQLARTSELTQDLGGYSSDSEHFQFNAPSNDR